ncbi:MAG: PEP-CTERM sorting domain-containing protein [Bryobacteraceae bacterium]
MQKFSLIVGFGLVMASGRADISKIPVPNQQQDDARFRSGPGNTSVAKTESVTEIPELSRTPEPGFYGLLAVGLGALGLAVRRRAVKAR